MLRIITLGLALQLFCTSCSPPKQEKEEIARQKKENLRRQVREFAVKHDADLQWLKDLEWGEFYTLELQKAILKPAGRSRLLLATVVDVIKRHDVYFLTAHDEFSDIYFQLQCDAQQAQYILSNGRRRLEQYAIVIQPESVHKPVAQLAGEIELDYAHVVHTTAEIFVVKGICVDILFLDGSWLFAKDLLETEETR